MSAPHHNFVVIAPMIMKFCTGVKLDVFYPGDFPRSSSKIINQSASGSVQNFGGPFHVRNVLTTCIIFFDL